MGELRHLLLPCSVGKQGHLSLLPCSVGELGHVLVLAMQCGQARTLVLVAKQCGWAKAHVLVAAMLCGKARTFVLVAAMPCGKLGHLSLMQPVLPVGADETKLRIQHIMNKTFSKYFDFQCVFLIFENCWTKHILRRLYCMLWRFSKFAQPWPIGWDETLT